MEKKIKNSLKLSLIPVILFSGTFGIAYGIKTHPQILQTSIVLEKRESIKPEESVIVNFSKPVLKGYEQGIRIVPDEKIKIRWEDRNQKLIINPESFWQPETDYKLIFPDGRSMMLTRIPAMQAIFSTEKFPQVISTDPVSGQKDVRLDIEDPIKVNFDKSTKNFFIKFVLSPAQDVAYQNNAEKTEFQLLPKEKVKEGEKYELKVYAKYAKASDSDYRQIFQSTFETLPPSPVTWDKNYTLRIEQAKKYTQAKILEGKYIDINLSAQIMSRFENGRLLDSFLISSGKRGMETPKGEHKIYNKSPRTWSKKYGLYMPFWMAITSSGSHGIHELPEWPGGYKEGANHLGIPVSHGCVRLGVGPAKIVYDWADIGTPVIVY